LAHQCDPEEDGERDGLDFFHIDQAIFRRTHRAGVSIGKHFVFRSETGQEVHQIKENPGWHVTLAVSPGNRHLLASGWGKPHKSRWLTGARITPERTIRSLSGI
jgi:hypothetical protein